MQTLFDMMIFVMIFVSIVIGAIVVYILTVMTIEDNFYNISLFKVIGYNNKEIDKMILGGYLIYGIIMFLVTIPSAILSFIALQLLMARMYNVVMPFEFSLWHGAVAIAIYIILFYLGANVAKRKLSRISLQEAMKMYQI
ncbi:MAG: FtsX-like permease family protein [Candidatus Izimaplasma bacterium HR2]|nr:MAG: FtsX-like permease family protein [Candidatus Izimaplasma bacterium HR2]